MIELGQNIKVGQEVGDFILRIERPFQCWVTPHIYKSCESNLQVPNLLQTPIIPWITHIFVKTIQD
jgi:hypothetical protein